MAKSGESSRHLQVKISQKRCLTRQQYGLMGDEIQRSNKKAHWGDVEKGLNS